MPEFWKSRTHLLFVGYHLLCTERLSKSRVGPPVSKIVAILVTLFKFSGFPERMAQSTLRPF